VAYEEDGVFEELCMGEALAGAEQRGFRNQKPTYAIAFTILLYQYQGFDTALEHIVPAMEIFGKQVMIDSNNCAALTSLY
jgi:hypothetical protein